MVTTKAGNARVLMLALADFANEEGYCWPGVTRLAAMMRVSNRTVQRLIVQCQEAGELKVKRRVGRHHTNLYQITLL